MTNIVRSEKKKKVTDSEGGIELSSGQGGVRNG